MRRTIETGLTKPDAPYAWAVVANDTLSISVSSMPPSQFGLYRGFGIANTRHSD